MAAGPVAPPVLSTPAEHLFRHGSPDAPLTESQGPRRTDQELRQVYEVAHTAQEILDGGRRRVALQFPDSMLGDAPRVVSLLRDEIFRLRPAEKAKDYKDREEREQQEQEQEQKRQQEGDERLYILADTSYSSCCVDEVAAEHVNADVIVHYGRTCLSPTSRLPVIHVFTAHQLDELAAVHAFMEEFADKEAKVVLMADVTYQDHVPSVFAQLRSRGYDHVLSTEVVHDPLGKIPNRSIVDAEIHQGSTAEASSYDLAEYAVFHISTPPTSLLLALSSRVKSFHIHHTPTAASPSRADSVPQSAPSTRAILGRRYAKVLSLSTAGIIGILVNTLSISNYLSSIDSIRQLIAAAGKKSYTMVVGKLNPAKLANFAEVDGWVVVGCWESSLVEDDASYYRPVITPFELEIALMKDEERVWGDRWWGGIEALRKPHVDPDMGSRFQASASEEFVPRPQKTPTDGIDEGEEESEPPKFDLRTGKLVSSSRPMRIPSGSSQQPGSSGPRRDSSSGILAVRPKSDLATVKGALSPGAEFLRSQRTWQGLGGDFDNAERSTTIEEGRSGVAKGYTVGNEPEGR